MKKPLKRGRGLWFIRGGQRVDGPHDRLRGDCSDLRGNCTGLRGDCSGLRGNCTGLRGNCTGLSGNLDDIPRHARPCDLADWIDD